MDFRIEHKGAPEQIVIDLSAAKSAIELAILAGKGRETSLPQLRGGEEQEVVLNGATLEVVTIIELIERARHARENSYAPYSHFNVGAAILAGNTTGERRIFGGCNVENAAYGDTICAERTAALKAVSDGFRKFLAYAVVGGFDDTMPKNLRRLAQKEYITPCGSCRQVTNEFDANPCLVILARDTGEVLMTTLNYLLPSGFGPRSLGVDASAYQRHHTGAGPIRSQK
jgi:cytidine deaminase